MGRLPSIRRLLAGDRTSTAAVSRYVKWCRFEPPPGDFLHASTTGEPHRQIEFGHQIADHLEHACLAGQGQPVYVRSADAYGASAQRERLEHVRPGEIGRASCRERG